MSLRLIPSIMTAALLAVVTSAAHGETGSVPAGTIVPVRLQNTVSSKTSTTEDRVTASVSRNISAGGRVVIPSGSELQGHVVAARRSGRVKGRAYVSIAFNQLVIGGKSYTISARRVSFLAPKTHGRDAKIIGGGAGAGALIGAIVDGKEGAAKGALIGAGAGTGTVLATRGKEVTLPAGSRLRVRLIRPIAID